jgi:hypothetical protein
MRRFASLLSRVLVLTVGLVVFVACNDGGGNGDNASYSDPCNQLRSCGTCTPVQGCGWCAFSDGTGACAADPSECSTAPTFTWTWGPDGCRKGADASVVAPDAAPAAPDAPAAADAGVDASSTPG